MVARINTGVLMLMALAANSLLFVHSRPEFPPVAWGSGGHMVTPEFHPPICDPLPLLLHIWFWAGLAVFVLLAAIAVRRRSIWLAVACSVIWLGSIAFGLIRIAGMDPKSASSGVAEKSYDWSNKPGLIRMQPMLSDRM